MTREEAVKIIRKEKECLSHDSCNDCILDKECNPMRTTPFDSEYIEAYEMAIKALEQEPCVDCISRQAVIDAIKNYASMLWEKYSEPFPESAIMEMIQDLPSVSPQPKMGRWEWVQYDGNINIGNWHCSECDRIVIGAIEHFIPANSYRYCPYCGAKMEVE